MERYSQHRRSGFSLLELTVVLALIGLLVGGILGGQALMRNSRVAKVLSDAKLYATATEQFRLQYGQLPGDFKTATSVWGDDASVCADAAVTDGIPGTCNGNGDGRYGIASVAGGTAEIFQLWKHLVLAGYIQGKYTGLNGPNGANYDAVANVNSPESAIKNAVFWHYDWGVQPASATFYEGDYTNTLTFGGVVSGVWPYQGVLYPSEAKNIDEKADDGLPGFGNIRPLAYSWLPNCSTSDTASASTYRLSYTSPACHLIFLKDFQVKNAL